MKIGEIVTKLAEHKVFVGMVVEVVQQGNVYIYKARRESDGFEFEGEVKVRGKQVSIVPALKGALFALALVGLTSSDSHAIECRTKAEGSGWSWRLIDGKRCWYKGSRRINKKLLVWAKIDRRPRVSPFVGESLPVKEPIVPMGLDEPLSFEDRWCALCIRGR